MTARTAASVRSWPRFGKANKGLSTTVSEAKSQILANLADNHNGNVELAKQLVALASSAGCDGVVVPHHRADTGYTQAALLQPMLDGSHVQTTRGELLRTLELSSDDLKSLRRSCQGRISFIGAPYDLQALADLEDSEPDGYQVDPPVLGHIPLLEAIASTGRPVILVAGRCTEDDIGTAVGMFGKQDVTLLHCVYAQSVSLESTALWYIPFLQQKFQIPTGYMGLESGINGSVAALALGARTIEKVFTSDRFLPGPSHASSLDRDELRELVMYLRQLENSLEGELPRVLLQPELSGAGDPQACLVAAHDLPAGETLSESMLSVKLAPDGIHPKLAKSLIGRRLAYDVPADAPLAFGVLEA